MNESRRRVLQMIWVVFLIMPGFHWFALQIVMRDPTFAPYLPFANPLPFQIVGALIAASVLVAWRLMLSPEALKRAGSGPEARLRSWLVRHIFLYVAVDTLSMVGLIVGCLSRSTRPATAFFAAAVFLTAVLFPNSGPLDESNRP